MNIAIVQLSDIHIKKEEDPILKRAGKIASVLNKYAGQVERIFLLLTGDIAFSGTKEQYELAGKFINSIKS